MVTEVSKEVLILGGTGAIGVDCCKLLSDKDVLVTVTSRQKRESYGNVRFVQGNAKDVEFIKSIVRLKKWDAIIDFLVYSVEEFKERMCLLLANTKQYLFLSSARVYAETAGLITEDTIRYIELERTNLLDDKSYPIAKALCEELLVKSGYKNWTIIRPGTTYNIERLDFTNLRKEEWLYRAINNKTVVVSEDLLSKRFTNTWGRDVAQGIVSLIGKEEALSNVFHITENNSYTWQEILDVIIDTLEKNHLTPKIKIVDKSPLLCLDNKREQYDNYMSFDHTFDNKKIGAFCDVTNFVDAKEGVKNCLVDFLREPKWREINWAIEGIHDRVSREYTSVWIIPSKKERIVYLAYRYHFAGVLNTIGKIRRRFRRQV